MNFKKPLARLVRYLFQRREKWKARALENQQELRNIQVKTRDLEDSTHTDEMQKHTGTCNFILDTIAANHDNEMFLFNPRYVSENRH